METGCRPERRAPTRTVAAALAVALAVAPTAGAIGPDEMVPHRRTVADIEAVSTAILAWITDQVGVHGGGAVRAPADGVPTFDVEDYPQVTAAELVPGYIAAVPAEDGWGRRPGAADVEPEFWLDVDDLLGPQVAAVRCLGRDGLAEGTVYPPGTYPAADFDRDTVSADGLAVQLPDGSLVFADDLEAGDYRFWSQP